MKVEQLFESWSHSDDGEWISSDPPDINDLDDESQLKLILDDFDNWNAVKNPSPNLIKMYFEAEPWSIVAFRERGIPVTKAMLYDAVARDPSIIGEIEAKEFPGNIIPDDLKWLAIKKQPKYITYFIPNPTTEMIKYALTNPSVIEDKQFYESTVRKLFANNTLLMKKWIRYGEAMRSQA